MKQYTASRILLDRRASALYATGTAGESMRRLPSSIRVNPSRCAPFHGRSARISPLLPRYPGRPTRANVHARTHRARRDGISSRLHDRHPECPRGHLHRGCANASVACYRGPRACDAATLGRRVQHNSPYRTLEPRMRGIGVPTGCQNRNQPPRSRRRPVIHSPLRGIGILRSPCSGH